MNSTTQTPATFEVGKLYYTYLAKENIDFVGQYEGRGEKDMMVFRNKGGATHCNLWGSFMSLATEEQIERFYNPAAQAEEKQG